MKETVQLSSVEQMQLLSGTGRYLFRKPGSKAHIVSFLWITDQSQLNCNKKFSTAQYAFITFWRELLNSTVIARVSQTTFLHRGLSLDIHVIISFLSRYFVIPEISGAGKLRRVRRKIGEGGASSLLKRPSLLLTTWYQRFFNWTALLVPQLLVKRFHFDPQMR
jgi:hypothetical protein